MTILTPEKPPYMNYHETENNPLLEGDGAEIPVFIGKTNNPVSNVEVKYYNNYSSIKVDVSKGGIGVEPENLEDNPLLFELKQFFTEAAGNAVTNDTVGIPRVYVIDLGNAPTVDDVLKATNEIKKIQEINVVVFVGFENEALKPILDAPIGETEAQKTARESTNTTNKAFNDPIVTKQVALMKAVNSDLVGDTAKGRFKIAYWRLRKDATIDEMTAFSSPLQVNESKDMKIQEVRTCLVENKMFGKIIARICVTPYYIEVGYDSFKTVDLEVFGVKSPEIRQELFDAGIIFGEDDYTLSTPIARICAGTTTAFGKSIGDRPNDCLLHARRNADYQLGKLLKVIAPQLKRNETATNIRYVQADCESYLASEKQKGKITGYNIKVTESNSNPYNIAIKSDITPVNSTYAIDISCFVNNPYITVSDEI